MRYMVMHKVDARMEAGGRPDQPIIQNMGKLIGRSLKAGTFLDGAGLHRSAQRVRLVFEGKQREIVRGPYRGSNELVAAFAMIVAASMDHAIELATRLATAAGDRELEIGPVVEPWDLTNKPRPADAPFRFLLLRKGGSELEGGAKQTRAVTAVLDEWKRDHILQTSGELAPSAQGARRNAATGRRWVDGPFTESKELVAGYSILELPSLDDVKAWADEYAEILGADTEVDLRAVA